VSDTKLRVAVALLCGACTDTADDRSRPDTDPAQYAPPVDELP
jgi:hypothetical protein